MRPSETRRSSVRRASSRRMGLWHEITTTSGVSSMMRSTPVAASMARMFRPSRPMMRPFMSSLGRGTTDTVLALRQLGFALGEDLDLPLDALFLLRHALLEREQLTTVIPHLALPLDLGLAEEMSCLALRLVADRLAFLARFLQDASRRGLGPALQLRQPLPTQPPDDPERARPESDADQQQEQQDHHAHPGHGRFSFIARAPR